MKCHKYETCPLKTLQDAFVFLRTVDESFHLEVAVYLLPQQRMFERAHQMQEGTNHVVRGDHPERVLDLVRLLKKQPSYTCIY